MKRIELAGMQGGLAIGTVQRMFRSGASKGEFINGFEGFVEANSRTRSSVSEVEPFEELSSQP